VRVGVDSGGTFTDVVTGDGRVAKVPSTPHDPAEAVRVGLGEDHPDLLSHGTTVATNALLERRLARVALVGTAGFADVIEIARQNRPSLYDPWRDRPAPLVARTDRLEVTERLDASGAVLVPFRAGSAPEVPEGVDSVAVVLLHADLDGRHEQAVADELRAEGHDVVASSEVSPEFREYERTVTTVVTAALRPVCGGYLRSLEPLAGEVVVMTSGGGLVDVHAAAADPAALLLSGPAAGAMAAARVAAACGFPDAIGFDMGGTSTDVCLILGGEPALTPVHEVAGLPIRLPSVDIHTVGAGGGSIARLDAGGALVVGPRSAGAVPGPVCYGRGGTEPTVTDADLVAGRIPAGVAFPGLGELDLAAAEAAVSAAGSTAEGILAVVDATMVQALRRVSVQRGVDPAGLALVAFGGAGPLHACELARQLGAACVIVPPAAGALSAVGLLTSPRRRELVRTWPTPADLRGLREAAAELSAAASAVGGAGGDGGGSPEVTLRYDCRYPGQSHELPVSTVEGFHEEHRRRNGYARADDPVEVTALRVTVSAPAPSIVEEVLGAWAGRVEPVVGPAVVARDDCTIWVPEGWRGEPGPLGALVLRR
jgi:N-methylhydantoinase A/oxoprolinase/acetone carboxylase beta subunit